MRVRYSIIEYRTTSVDKDGTMQYGFRYVTRDPPEKRIYIYINYHRNYIVQAKTKTHRGSLNLSPDRLQTIASVCKVSEKLAVAIGRHELLGFTPRLDQVLDSAELEQFLFYTILSIQVHVDSKKKGKLRLRLQLDTDRIQHQLTQMDDGDHRDRRPLQSAVGAHDHTELSARSVVAQEERGS